MSERRAIYRTDFDTEQAFPVIFCLLELIGLKRAALMVVQIKQICVGTGFGTVSIYIRDGRVKSIDSTQHFVDKDLEEVNIEHI